MVWLFISLAGFQGAQGKVKCCPFVQFSLRPYPPTVLMHDSLDDGEPHASAFEILLAVEPLEDAK
jgi:hypothetical protein